MRILCTGDLQLGVHGRLADQAEVLGRIAGLAVERQVDLVLDGGDTFEGPGIPPECLEVFARFVRALRICDIPVMAISGNGRHDAAMRETNGLAIFEHIEGIAVASRPDVYRFDGCTVAALPWVSPSRLAAKHGSDTGRDEVNQEAALLLVEVARGLREDCRRVAADLPAVLLTHFAISGASLPTGLPVDQLREPVLPLAELEQLGFDAIVASHIHKPQLLATDPAEPELPVFYTGSPLAHDFGEAGYEHGVWILDLPRMEEVECIEFLPIPSRPLVTLDLDPDDLGGDVVRTDDVPEGAIVRVRYTATREQQSFIDTGHVRQALLDAGAVSVKLIPEIVRADRARVEGLDDQAGELDALEQWLRSQGIVGVDEPVELAEPTRLLADRMRQKTCSYLEAAA